MNYLTAMISIYTAMLVFRALMSWIPKIENSKAGRYLAKITDPYLNLFRFIPTIGMIDISPMVAIFVFQYATNILINIIIQLAM